jgi:hypothetical protein
VWSPEATKSANSPEASKLRRPLAGLPASGGFHHGGKSQVFPLKAIFTSKSTFSFVGIGKLIYNYLYE